MILVGLVAGLIYWLQERKKISEAASLVITQIEDLQKRMREISSYITEGKLDDVSFYESQILYQTDYWDQYRHYWVRRLDASSLGTIDEFFRCAAEVKEQQELMKNLQKNFFFQKQQMILQLECNYICQDLQISNQTAVDKSALIEGLIEKLTPYALRELIQGIYVEAPDKSTGKRRQTIHIKYDGIGFIPLVVFMNGKTA